MSRSLRIEFPNAFYHITSRGNAQQEIFLGDHDRRLFLQLLDEVVHQSKWICHGFCLMTNHYHLLVETPESNLSNGMRELNGRYCQSFNLKHSRSGHVLQGRFDSRIVQKDAYLLAVSRYIVMNPVRAHLVNEPSSWPWSSYHATVSKANWAPFLSREFTLAYFSTDEDKARAEYRQFVTAPCDSSPWDDLRGGVLLGTDEFAKSIEHHFRQKCGDRNIPLYQLLAARVALQSIFANPRLRRDELIRRAYYEHGYKMKEIAAFLGITAARVSQIVGRSNSRLEKIDLTPIS
jgi:putative transposase